MIVRAKIPHMSRVSRALSLILLAAGVIFVFTGVNLAVGWSAIGVVATTAAVACIRARSGSVRLRGAIRRRSSTSSSSIARCASRAARCAV